jgi:hypothetical protein
MGWQSQVFARLRDRDWHRVGDLFDEVEGEIALHYAMRFVMHPGRGRSELPPASYARWRFFLSRMSLIGVDRDAAEYKWDTRVRLRYVAGQVCGDCGSPVIKASWSAKQATACLACEQPTPAPKSTPEAPSVPIPEMPPPELLPLAAIPMRRVELFVRNRRELARYLKRMLGAISINAMERELEHHRDDAPAVLRRHGSNWPSFIRWLHVNYGLIPYHQIHPP